MDEGLPINSLQGICKYKTRLMTNFFIIITTCNKAWLSHLVHVTTLALALPPKQGLAKV
jgi:hypothetical protein